MGRIAHAISGGVEDTEFRSLLRQIDGDAPIHPGNRVDVYADGLVAVDAMIAAIDSAKREVLLESYIFSDDEAGFVIRKRLLSAAERGVSVRVLADAFGSAITSRSFWNEMREGGIKVRIFNRLLKRPSWKPLRDHRKILVIDQRVAFTGGMNIGNAYFGFSRATVKPTPKLKRDTHVRIEGPAAAEMAGVFAEGWSHETGDDLELQAPSDTPTGGSAGVLVSESLPPRGQMEMAAVFAAIVAAARKNVWITNAYFAPRRLAVSILAAAARRGVDVRLLLPGLTDHPVVKHAGHAHFSRMLRSGVRIFEYQSALLHAKTLVVDGAISVVGSANLDMRSLKFNAECNAVIFDSAVASTLETIFREDLERSVEIEIETWKSRGVLHKILDRSAVTLTPLL